MKNEEDRNTQEALAAEGRADAARMEEHALRCTRAMQSAGRSNDICQPMADSAVMLRALAATLETPEILALADLIERQRGKE